MADHQAQVRASAQSCSDFGGKPRQYIPAQRLRPGLVGQQ
jgi:hypothetical protein